MAVTDRITGKNVYIKFDLQELYADFTSITVNEESGEVDLTGGADDDAYFTPTFRSGTIDYELFYSSGTAQSEFDALLPGSAGSLVIGPKGTTATYPKLSWTRVITRSRRLTLPFAGESKVSGTFRISGQLTRGSWS
ncbi:MAG TPA: hypothetical protein VM537_18540 [Anaerolineae bacterium]|nr:hypothetical protein [Anaerolineae bacterium]